MDFKPEFAPDYQPNFLKPLVNSWLGRIQQAKEARSSWEKVANECMHFYESVTNFMWDANSKAKFWEGVTAPKFQIVVSKAFELVAQIGPSLFFRSPKRMANPIRRPGMSPQVFGDVENDPMAQQMFAQYQQEFALDMQSAMARAKLMESWLNYTPDQIPSGGLEDNAELAITEALIKGRGVLWPEPYRKPGSDKTLTGLFFDSVDNLFIDPDAKTLAEARWIARRRVKPYTDVEKMFGLPKHSLRDKATLESLTHDVAGKEEVSRKPDVKAKDLIVYYEIYSRSGCGCDYSGLDSGISDRLEAVCGDHVYLAICPSVDYPLNVSTGMLYSGATDEVVRQSMEWPIPFWRHGEFPCAILDFYQSSKSAWPMPPLGPGIGELKFLNLMISHVCNRIWMSSRDFIAVAKSAQREIEDILLKGNDLAVLPVSDVHQDIKNMIGFLQQPQVNFDVWQIIDRVSDMFDKRTGLTDLVYGMTETQSRSAEDAATKRQAVSVRPDHMARKVERWMSRASAMEAMVAHLFVKSHDVMPLVGRTAAQMWQMLVESQPEDVVIREMEYTVAAGSGRRRNHELELANLNQALQFFFPELSKQADITTDTSAINSLIQRWGDAAQIDLSDVEIGPRMPPPPQGPSPEEQQMQMEMQMQQESHEMDMKSKEMDMQAKMFELQIRQAEAQMDAESQQAKSQADMVAEVLKLQTTRQMAEQKIEQAEADSQIKARQSLLDLVMSGRRHEQELGQDQQKHVQEMEQLRQAGQIKAQQAKQMAAQKASQQKKKPSGKSAA